MSKYADIIERLGTATGPDREIETEIWLMTTEGATRKSTTVKSSGNKWPPYIIDETRDGTGRLVTVPAFTASIHEAIALVERMLPGSELEMTNLYGVARVTIHDEQGQFYGLDECNRLQTALLIALFRALEAKEAA
jgi:hypothetical protein